jgi:hypothetical protein
MAEMFAAAVGQSRNWLCGKPPAERRRRSRGGMHRDPATAANGRDRAPAGASHEQDARANGRGAGEFRVEQVSHQPVSARPDSLPVP